MPNYFYFYSQVNLHKGYFNIQSYNLFLNTGMVVLSTCN